MEKPDISVWLKRVENALRSEGFKDTLLQIWKEGQVFGLVKKIDNVWEMHVRGFKDGHLEAEIEISRDYIEHLDDRFRRSAISELTEILDKYNIPYKVVGNLKIESKLEPPSTLTPWKPIVTLIIIVGILAWIAGSKK